MQEDGPVEDAHRVITSLSLELYVDMEVTVKVIVDVADEMTQ